MVLCYAILGNEFRDYVDSGLITVCGIAWVLKSSSSEGYKAVNTCPVFAVEKIAQLPRGTKGMVRFFSMPLGSFRCKFSKNRSSIYSEPLVFHRRESGAHVGLQPLEGICRTSD